MPRDHRLPAMSDEQLVRVANRGDSQAFVELYHRHKAWVLRVARRFSDDEAMALDVMQETFIELMKRFPGFELRSKLTTFLYPVIRHTALAWRRKHARATTDLPRPPRPDGASVDDEITAALAQVIDRLPPGQREVVLLRFVDDLALQDIATAVQLPLGTVKSRLHLAMKAMRANPGLRDLLDRSDPEKD